MVFHCYWDTVPVYVTAELLGALLAALLTMPLYGFGPHVSGGSQPMPDAEVSSSSSMDFVNPAKTVACADAVAQ